MEELGKRPWYLEIKNFDITCGYATKILMAQLLGLDKQTVGLYTWDYAGPHFKVLSWAHL